MALAAWKAKALRIFPPQYTKDEYYFVLNFFGEGLLRSKQTTLLTSDAQREIKSYLKDSFDMSDKEVKPILSVVQDVVGRLRSSELIKVSGDVITDCDFAKILELQSLFRFIRQSVERMLRWTVYYLFENGQTKFAVDDISKLNRELSGEKIKSALNKIVASCVSKGMKFERHDELYFINHPSNDRSVAKYLIDEIELLSRWSTSDLEYSILGELDRSPSSNKKLSELLEVDESTISRIVKRLQQEKLIKIVGMGRYGRQYLLTNCDNCPWALDKQECRRNSINSLTALFKENFAIDLQESYFDDVENQALLHLIDMFQHIGDGDTSFEMQESRVLKQLLDAVAMKIGSEKISTDSAMMFRMKDEKGRVKTLKLPILYSIGVLQGGEEAARYIGSLLEKMPKEQGKRIRQKILKQMQKDGLFSLK